ncbi:MAG: FHA domain-containing protein, partial [Deltaproteobacteria bacterium]|nr:FHA domain-containing protein [Deltaproteobacteria bacterium]
MQTLIVLNKEGAVENRYPLQNGELLIGRSRGNGIVLPSTSVSRQHARVYTAQGRTYIQDLNSSNGILVNGVRIQETAELAPGLEIRIGEFVLYLQQEAAPPAASPYGPAGYPQPPPPTAAPPQPPAAARAATPPPSAPRPPTVPPSPAAGHGRPNPLEAARYRQQQPPPASAPMMPPVPTPAAPPPPAFASAPPPAQPAAPTVSPESPFAQAAPAPPEDGSYPRLVGINQPFMGEEWVLSELENTIGRTEDNFILLPDPSVSRNHARIVRDSSGSYTVYDLRSSNSTAVNRKRISQATLRDGDLVSFGNVAFRFVLSRSGESSLSRGAQRGGGSKALLVVLGIFLGVLLLGGIVVGIFFLRDFSEKRAREEKQHQIAEAIAQAQEKIKANAWSEAQAQLEAALVADPTNTVMLQLKERVEANRQAKETLDEAAALGREDKLEEAL